MPWHWEVRYLHAHLGAFYSEAWERGNDGVVAAGAFPAAGAHGGGPSQGAQLSPGFPSGRQQLCCSSAPDTEGAHHTLQHAGKDRCTRTHLVSQNSVYENRNRHSKQL